MNMMWSVVRLAPPVVLLFNLASMKKEKFMTYVAIQKSWATNMFDVRTVVELSRWELTREDCFDIMNNYEKYDKEYKTSNE